MANNKPAESFQRFNLDTMSGITAGTRTQRFQRLKLQNQTGESQWARLLWHNDPPSCALYLQTGEGDTWSSEPFVQFSLPSQDEINEPQFWLHELKSSLSKKSRQLQSCGNCAQWQPYVATDDRSPMGRCSYQWSQENVPEILAQQSGFALACNRWLIMKDILPEIVPDDQPVPMEKFAEQATSRPTIGQRIKNLFRPRKSAQPKSWQAQLVERSGVGAGTEPCLVCQGRIANLGAVTVQSAGGHKQTFSVWRCRDCYTLYLNDWIDRWERSDTLETEECYYRLAPSDAAQILQKFYHNPGGEHPVGHHLRGEQRAWFEDFLANHVAISHQVRRGR